MSRLPSLTFAGLALLLAAVPARANESAAAAPVESAAAPAETAAAAPPAGDGSESPLVTVPTAWREPASSRPAKRWSTSAEVDSNSYRVSLSRGKLDLGMGFDAPAGVATRTARSIDPAGPIVPTLPSLSIGLRSATAGSSSSSLIARAGASGEDAIPASTRRVGLEWKPAQSSIFVRGGVRLTGDDRVTMRVRSGRVGVYMKSTF